MVYSDIHSSQFRNSGSSVLEIFLMEFLQYLLLYWSKQLNLDRRRIFSSLRDHFIFIWFFSWTAISLAYTRTELCGFIHPHSPVFPNIFLSSMVSVPSTLSVCITSKPAFSAGQAPHCMAYRDFSTHNLAELGAAGPDSASPVRKMHTLLFIPRDIPSFFWWGAILCSNPKSRGSHFEFEFVLPFYHSHKGLLGLFFLVGTRCVAIFMWFKCRRQTWVVLSTTSRIFFISDSQGHLNECDYLL